MPTYLLFLHEDPSVFEQVSPEEMQAIIQKYSSWKQRMLDAGVLTGGEKLQDGTGRVLLRAAGRAQLPTAPIPKAKRLLEAFFKSERKTTIKPCRPRATVLTLSTAQSRSAKLSRCLPHVREKRGNNEERELQDAHIGYRRFSVSVSLSFTHRLEASSSDAFLNRFQGTWQGDGKLWGCPPVCR